MLLNLFSYDLASSFDSLCVVAICFCFFCWVFLHFVDILFIDKNSQYIVMLLGTEVIFYLN